MKNLRRSLREAAHFEVPVCGRRRRRRLCRRRRRSFCHRLPDELTELPPPAAVAEALAKTTAVVVADKTGKEVEIHSCYADATTASTAATAENESNRLTCADYSIETTLAVRRAAVSFAEHRLPTKHTIIADEYMQ